MAGAYGDATTAATISAIGSFAGGERRNRAQINMSRRQMQFQERMSSTAYQRGMEDMKRAGLNPMLAAGLGGASSPMGSMPQIQDTISPAIASGYDAYKKGTEAEQTKAQTALTNAETILKESLIPTADTARIIAQGINDLVKAGKETDADTERGSGIINRMERIIKMLFTKSEKLGIASQVGKLTDIKKPKTKKKKYKQNIYF